jgi:hypothetical protein
MFLKAPSVHFTRDVKDDGSHPSSDEDETPPWNDQTHLIFRLGRRYLYCEKDDLMEFFLFIYIYIYIYILRDAPFQHRLPGTIRWHQSVHILIAMEASTRPLASSSTPGRRTPKSKW